MGESFTSILRFWRHSLPEEDDVFLCDAASADVADAAAVADVFLETISMTVEAIEDPPSGLSSDPFEVVLDPPAKNGFSGLASAGPAGLAGSLAAAAPSAAGGLSFSCFDYYIG